MHILEVEMPLTIFTSTIFVIYISVYITHTHIHTPLTFSHLHGFSMLFFSPAEKPLLTYTGRNSETSKSNSDAISSLKTPGGPLCGP